SADSAEAPQLETRKAGRVSVSEETARRLSCDASHVEMQPDGTTGRRSRKVSAGTRRALNERDQGCRFPGCGNRIVDNHHVKHWQDGGETTLRNMIQLCRFHHTQVHEGGYTLALAEGGAPMFLDPQGRAALPPRPLPLAAGLASQAEPWRGV